MEFETLDYLKQKMEALGFRWQGRTGDGCQPGLFYKRIVTRRPCICNEGDQLAVEVWDNNALPGGRPPFIPEGQRFSLTMEVVGEFPVSSEHGTEWAKLQVYGLSPKDFFTKHERLTAALIRAWEALA